VPRLLALTSTMSQATSDRLTPEGQMMDSTDVGDFQVRRLCNYVYSPLVILVAATALCLQIVFGIANGHGLRWDFANFYDAGHKVWMGEIDNLYEPTALIKGKPPQGEMAFYGTPLSAILYAPLAWFPPSVALALFKLQNTLANLAGIVLLYWQHRRIGEVLPGHRVSFLALFIMGVALYQPFWEIYQIGGQATPTVFLALVLALLWHSTGRDFLAALLFVLAVAIKPAFVLGLVVLTLLSRRRFMTYVAGTGLILGLISIVWAGWPVHEAFLRRILTEVPKPWLYNSSVTVAFDNLRTLLAPRPESFSYLAIGAIIRLGISGLLIGLVVRQRSRVTRNSAQRHLNFLIAITSCLLLMPVVWEHYLALLFIPLSYCLAVYRLMPRAAQCLIGIIFLASIAQNVSVIAWLNTIIYFNTPTEVIMAGIIKAAPLSLTALLFIAYGREIFKTCSLSEWGSNCHGERHHRHD